MAQLTPPIIGSPEAAPGAQLPARYGEEWYGAFVSRVEPFLIPGAQILDVGSGAAPALAPEQRPERCLYVGLDLSTQELGRAAAGSYDETIEADVATPLPHLRGRFDLILSWQVLEHVEPLDAALSNLRSYLRPGGRMVAMVSGGRSAFGLVNRLVSPRVGVWMLKHLLGRDPDTVFPAHYDRCYHTALLEMLTTWSRAEVIPLFRGASYFRFSRRIQGAYIRYENWAAQLPRRNLASHYLLLAEP